MKKDEIDKALKYDSLSEAEKITGKSYKEDELTGKIGFMNHVLHSQKKNDLLNSVDDTTFSESEEEYLRKVTDFGFEILLKDEFETKEGKERFYIMFHRKYSILLSWDTFRGSRNGGKLYYNFIIPESGRFDMTSSGGCVNHSEKPYSYLFNQDITQHMLPDELRNTQPKWKTCDDWDEYDKQLKIWESKVDDYLLDKKLITIWSGDHDCREGLKHNMNKIAEQTTFLKKWVNQPFLWLLHHGDTEKADYDYKEINKERISRLPKDIQEIIKGQY